MSRYFNQERIVAYLKLSLFQTLLFGSVYSFTNWLASRHNYHFHFWLSSELNIPFIPEMILAYISINLLMMVPAFTLSVKELQGLSRAMTWSTLIAAFFFIFLPAPTGYVPVHVTGTWQEFYRTLYQLDRPTNTFPSLHITYSFLFVRIILSSIKKLKIFFWMWFTLIAISVLVTHQHHLIDIVGGIILAEFCFKKFYLRVINE